MQIKNYATASPHSLDSGKSETPERASIQLTDWILMSRGYERGDNMKNYEQRQKERRRKEFMKRKEDKVALAVSYGLFIAFWFVVLALAMGG